MKFKSTKNTSLLEIIKDNLGFSSNSKARNLIKSGAVKVDDAVVKIPSASIKTNQLISIYPPKKMKSAHEKAPASNYRAVFEDDHFIAFIKPPGLLAVATENNKRNEKNFVDLIQRQYRYQTSNTNSLFPINRVDRKYSGIMLFAKSAPDEMEIRTRWDESSKRYYALVEGTPKKEKGHIESHLKQNRIGRVYSAPKSEYGKMCALDYRVMYSTGKYSLLKIDVMAERKNSVSAQLSEMKLPIAGDKDYKGHTSPIKRFGLHLFSLHFYHPFKKEQIEIKTPIPHAFKSFFKQKTKD